jgi:hypothetical protein
VAQRFFLPGFNNFIRISRFNCQEAYRVLSIPNFNFEGDLASIANFKDG